MTIRTVARILDTPRRGLGPRSESLLMAYAYLARENGTCAPHPDREIAAVCSLTPARMRILRIRLIESGWLVPGPAAEDGARSYHVNTKPRPHRKGRPQ